MKLHVRERLKIPIEDFIFEFDFEISRERINPIVPTISNWKINDDAPKFLLDKFEAGYYDGEIIEKAIKETGFDEW